MILKSTYYMWLNLFFINNIITLMKICHSIKKLMGIILKSQKYFWEKFFAS